MNTTTDTGSMYVYPSIFQRFNKVVAAQSTRHGGVASDFGSFNLGESVGDDPAIVEQNRALFARGLGFEPSQLVKSMQVHGVDILYATTGGSHEGYDAIYTDKPGLLIAVTIADCVPILLYDAQLGLISAIHAGWKGSRDGLVTRVIDIWKSKFGSAAEDIYAYIGACISGKSYEVDYDVAQHFEEKHRPYDETSSKYYLNLPQQNYDQMTAAGLLAEHIELSDYCTLIDKDKFYTHRGDKGRSGRMLAAIGMLEK